eukprot:TRINITY_DN5432_c0_g1_i5.p1 TRINITY_DN5432_c0_g1~~TRINITY_DN5432_c0_g1_i5.p1  ORF type:complete len:371 (-),score=88.61 TRINITY_DN5432_c0_g1_i5:74-1186(-)
MSSVPGSWRMQMLPAASQKVPAVLLLPGVPTIVPPAPALPPRVLPAEFSVPPPPARDAPQINRAGPCLDLADAFQPSALESPGCAPKLREDNLKSSNADGSLTTQAKEEARCHWRESKRPRARWADMMCSSDDEDTHTSFSWSVGSGSSSDTTAPGSTITQGASALGTPESQRTASFEQVDDGCFGSDQEDVDHWQEEAFPPCDDVVSTNPDALTGSCSEASGDSHRIDDLEAGDLEVIHVPVHAGTEQCCPESQCDARSAAEPEARTARNQRKKARRAAVKQQQQQQQRFRFSPPAKVLGAGSNTGRKKSLSRYDYAARNRGVRAAVTELVVELAGRQVRLLLGIGSFFVLKALRHPRLAACAALCFRV